MVCYHPAVINKEFHLTNYLFFLIIYFSDLISAYKGLTNEKEALEASVKALSSVKAVTHATSSRQLEESDTHGDGEDGNLSGDEVIKLFSLFLGSTVYRN